MTKKIQKDSISEKMHGEDLILQRIAHQIEVMLIANRHKIFCAYKQFGEEKFPISISVKLSGTTEVVESEVSLGFVMERVKEISDQTINVNQRELFNGGNIDPEK